MIGHVYYGDTDIPIETVHVDGQDRLVVTYATGDSSNIFTTVLRDKTKVLKCKGKLMKSNVVVNNKVLTCYNKVMKDDITIFNGPLTSEEYLTFTLLDNDTYEVKAKDINNIPAEVVIPQMYNGKAVTSIGNQAFNNCRSLTSIIISDSAMSIGYQAFYNCISLTSIIIPDTVTSIGEMAFTWCSGLTNINVNVNNKSYKSIDGNLYSKDGTKLIQYAIGKTESSFVIPEEVTIIGEDAFSGCTVLTSVTLGNSVTSIGNQAFNNCSGLTSITIPDSVTSIGAYAFSSCRSLTSVTIPDNVTSIGEGVFNSCSGLTSVIISNGVTNIGNQAFEGCSSLTNINVDENNKNYKSIDGNLYSKDGTILIQYAIGKTESSFVIPDSVTSIARLAFYDCKSLISVTISDSVTSIPLSAFNSCSRLNSVTIGNSVTSIGSYAFGSCVSLTSITCKALNPPTIELRTFMNVPATCAIYVPAESVEAYKTAQYWSERAAYIQAILEV